MINKDSTPNIIKSKKIIVSGGWSYGNIGDEVIALCTIFLISKYFEGYDKTYTSYDKEDFANKYNVKVTQSVHNIIDTLPENSLDYKYISEHLDECGLEEYCELLKTGSIFIMSGGGYFVGDWKSNFIARVLEIELAKKAGLKVAIIGQSIGPVYSNEDRNLLKTALDKCDYISVRDLASVNYLESINVKAEIHYYPDLATICSDIVKPEEKKNVVCISPADYVGYQSIKKSRQKQFVDSFIKRYHILQAIKWRLNPFRRRYFREFKKLVEEISKHKHISFVMSTDWEGNKGFTDYLCSNIDKKSYDVICCKDAEELCKRISETNVLISSKMHPLIIAYSYGIPIFGISYNFKLDNFMKMIGRSKECFLIGKIDHKMILRLMNQEQNAPISQMQVKKYKDKVYSMMEQMSLGIRREE